jgi:hypothetical protein
MINANRPKHAYFTIPPGCDQNIMSNDAIPMINRIIIFIIGDRETRFPTLEKAALPAAIPNAAAK